MTGKTVVANRLVELLKGRLGASASVEYKHLDRPKATFKVLPGLVGMVERLPTVWDRFHLSTVAYGVALGAYDPRVRHDEILALQRYMRWMGCVTLLLYYSDGDLLATRLAENDRPEMYSNGEILIVNGVYHGMIYAANRTEPWADFTFDVSSKWPDDSVLAPVIDAWIGRQS